MSETKGLGNNSKDVSISYVCNHFSLKVCCEHCSETLTNVSANPAVKEERVEVQFLSKLEITHDPTKTNTTNAQDNSPQVQLPPLKLLVDTTNARKPSTRHKRKVSHKESERQKIIRSTREVDEEGWKIKKVLKESDVGDMSRLLLPRDLAEKLVVPVLGGDAYKGIQVQIKDIDTDSMHSLIFKKWDSSKCYVFIGNWVKDFVKRRCLKKDDHISFRWDPQNHHFDFCVLLHAN